MKEVPESFYLFIYLFTYIFIYLSNNLFMYLFIYLFTYLFAYLFIYSIYMAWITVSLYTALKCDLRGQSCALHSSCIVAEP